MKRKGDELESVGQQASVGTGNSNKLKKPKGMKPIVQERSKPQVQVPPQQRTNSPKTVATVVIPSAGGGPGTTTGAAKKRISTEIVDVIHAPSGAFKESKISKTRPSTVDIPVPTKSHKSHKQPTSTQHKQSKPKQEQEVDTWDASDADALAALQAAFDY